MKKNMFIMLMSSLFLVLSAFVMNAGKLMVNGEKVWSYSPEDVAVSYSTHKFKYKGYNSITKLNGNTLIIPKIAFGTDFGYGVTDKEKKKILSDAINAGFRVFDTAQSYGESASILAEVIKGSGIPREEFFVIYKFSLCDSSSTAINSVIEQFSGYVDVLMEHFTSGPYSEDILKYIKGQISIGRVGFFGLSNVADIETLTSYNWKDFPRVSFVQNQFNPFRLDSNIRKYCRTHGIVYMGYATLGGGGGCCGQYYSFSLLQEPLMQSILAYNNGKKDCPGVTPQQLLLGWAYTKTDILIVRASTPDHIDQDKESKIKKVAENLLYKGMRVVLAPVFDVAKSLSYSDQELDVLKKNRVARIYFNYLYSEFRNSPITLRYKLDKFLKFISIDKNYRLVSDISELEEMELNKVWQVFFKRTEDQCYQVYGECIESLVQCQSDPIFQEFITIVNRLNKLYFKMEHNEDLQKKVNIKNIQPKNYPQMDYNFTKYRDNTWVRFLHLRTILICVIRNVGTLSGPTAQELKKEMDSVELEIMRIERETT